VSDAEVVEMEGLNPRGPDAWRAGRGTAIPRWRSACPARSHRQRTRLSARYCAKSTAAPDTSTARSRTWPPLEIFSVGAAHVQAPAAAIAYTAYRWSCDDRRPHAQVNVAIDVELSGPIKRVITSAILRHVEDRRPRPAPDDGDVVLLILALFET
jgi:hypothetical protein